MSSWTCPPCLDSTPSFCLCLILGGGDFKSPEQFKLSLPQRTNYLYGRITKSLPEMYAFTLCMWIKSSATPGIGTPFSYGVPGQANEIVLIEWGNNPIELLINDRASNSDVILMVASSGEHNLKWKMTQKIENVKYLLSQTHCCPDHHRATFKDKKKLHSNIHTY